MCLLLKMLNSYWTRVLSNNLKILLSIIIFFTSLIAFNTNVSATNYQYDHNALLQYEGYDNALYESMVKQTYYVAGAETGTQDYVNNTIDEVMEYAYLYPAESCNNIGDCLGDFFIGVGDNIIQLGDYIITTGSWLPELFNSFNNQNGSQIPDEKVPINDYSSIEQAFSVYSGGSYAIKVNPGYLVTLILPNGTIKNLSVDDVITAYLSGQGFPDDSKDRSYYAGKVNNVSGSPHYMSLESWYEYHNRTDKESVNGVINAIHFAGASMSIEYKGLRLDIPDYSPKPKPINIINNYIQEDNMRLPIPKPKPVLSCPNGVQMNLIVDESNFLDNKGKVVNVDLDGTSNDCSLTWIVPNIYYDNAGNVVMEDPDGTIIIPPGDTDIIEKPDNSLLAYIANAYNYGVNALKTGVEGLTSVVNGSAGLINLYERMFSWLPKEMVAFLTGGLLLMIGLRVIRK